MTLALRWFIDRQGSDGLWRSAYAKARDRYIHHWVSYAVVRLLQRASAM